jgi:hypothetical protein
MRYTVTWVPSAEADLADIWNEANDRSEISIAANQIDAQLRFDPAGVGESRASGRRILFASPLAVIYRINHHDQIVRVTEVWVYRRR